MVTGEYQIISHLYSPISQSQICFICLWSPVFVIRKTPQNPFSKENTERTLRRINRAHISYRLCMPLVIKSFKTSGGNSRIFLIALHKSHKTKTSHFVTSPVFTNIVQPYQTGPPPPTVNYLGLYCACAQALLYSSFCLISSMLCQFFPVVSNIKYFQIMVLRFKIPES